MSNHTAQEPSGYLDGYNFKSFFGVTGKPGKFVWQRGQERVPDNWVSSLQTPITVVHTTDQYHTVPSPFFQPIHCT